MPPPVSSSAGGGGALLDLLGLDTPTTNPQQSSSSPALPRQALDGSTTTATMNGQDMTAGLMDLLGVGGGMGGDLRLTSMIRGWEH